MTASTASVPSPLPSPRALLLDFGGVIITTVKRDGGVDEAATYVHGLLERGLVSVPAEDVARSLASGLTALTHWKHASSRRREPRELSPREIVGDFLASDLPEPARRLLVAEAAELLDAIATITTDHHLRPGIMRTLDAARDSGIPVGIVSNAHSGRSHRRILSALGIHDRFAVQVYSDEVGIRKPHPGMLHLAATAVGVAVEDCWYVGDTQDRDVVAGRRAGVGTVIITRDKHTDRPPFEVGESADAVLDSPEQLADALVAALRDGGHAAAGAARADESGSGARGALLIDHGGVISLSEPNPEEMLALGERLSDLLSTPDAPVEPGDAIALIRAARDRRAAAKGDGLAETSPLEFWVEHFGHGMDDRSRAVLRAEAVDLMHRYGRAKSRRVLRPGVADALAYCRAAGMPVVVVSNTLSGRAVRDACAEHGLSDLIGAYVCSDELGLRKPHASIVAEALAIADAAPEASWFYGDKPHADAAGAQAAGIARRVVVRGGAIDDEAIDRAVADGLATHAVEDAHGLLALLQGASALPTLSPAEPA
ncbi:HAD family hydrolase [Demequina sp. NBRC 110056]|uniref:HAD family hydrolase n=1 Tax=Demequina sp. NBRC 110056 TaxID=1570345 RepID=UPI001356289C|nr:HAD-IA family hydrolase [Demequina sp. NBRC 110056]